MRTQSCPSHPKIDSFKFLAKTKINTGGSRVGCRDNDDGRHIFDERMSTYIEHGGGGGGKGAFGGGTGSRGTDLCFVGA